LVHSLIDPSKQAGGIGDRSEAFGTYGTQDRKPKSLKQIQALKKWFPRFLGQYNNRLSGTPSIGMEFALPEPSADSFIQFTAHRLRSPMTVRVQQFSRIIV
jgi:hypothetical protein